MNHSAEKGLDLEDSRNSSASAHTFTLPKRVLEGIFRSPCRVHAQGCRVEIFPVELVSRPCLRPKKKGSWNIPEALEMQVSLPLISQEGSRSSARQDRR